MSFLMIVFVLIGCFVWECRLLCWNISLFLSIFFLYWLMMLLLFWWICVVVLMILGLMLSVWVLVVILWE